MYGSEAWEDWHLPFHVFFYQHNIYLHDYLCELHMEKQKAQNAIVALKYSKFWE